MKYCFNCGSSLEDQAKFCPACGSKQPEAQAAQPVAPQEPPLPVFEEAAPPVAPQEPTLSMYEEAAPPVAPQTPELPTQACPSCGFANDPQVLFCANCGTNMQSPPPPPPPVYEAPVSPVYEAPPAYEAPAYQAPPSFDAPPADGQDGYAPPFDVVNEFQPKKAPATLWLVLNIVFTVIALFVCCPNVVGIIGIIFAAMGMGKHKNGDIEGGNKNVNVAKIMGIISIAAIGLLVIAAVFILIIAMVNGSSFVDTLPIDW